MILHNSWWFMSDCPLSTVPSMIVGHHTHIRYKYTSFFWSKSAVAMFFKTSGKRAETSLPSVIDMIVFCMASFLPYFQHDPEKPS